MRHRNASLRLSQKPDHAWLMLRNLVTSLLLYERIRTTQKRARAAAPLVARVLTMGKKLRPDLAIRRINRIVTHENACRKVLEVLRLRYDGRSGGYTRITPVGLRKGDGARLVDMVLLDGVKAVAAGKGKEEESGARIPKNTQRTRKTKTSL